MEEALFLARYASKVFVVQRFPWLEASKIMARRAVSHHKIEVRAQTTALQDSCTGTVHFQSSWQANRHCPSPPAVQILWSCEALEAHGHEDGTLGGF